MSLPDAIYLCPVHRDEFYVDHDGVCPQFGCDQQLVGFWQAPHAAPRREAESGLPLVDRGIADDLYRTACEYRELVTPVPALDKRLARYLDWKMKPTREETG